MSNPILTITEKNRAVYGGLSYTIPQAKAITNFSTFDKVFMNDGTGPFTYGAFMFLDVPSITPDTPGILINVTSGGILVNEKIYPLLVDSDIEAVIESSLPSFVPLNACFYNTEINKFRLFYVNNETTSIASYPSSTVEVLNLSDFGTPSGGIIVLNQELTYVLSDNIDISGITLNVLSNITILSPSNKSLFTFSELETSPTFILNDGANLNIQNVFINTESKDLFSRPFFSSNTGDLTVSNCNINCKTFYIGTGISGNFNFFNNQIIAQNGCYFPSSSGYSFFSITYRNNYLEDTNNLTFFDLNGINSGLIEIIDNESYFTFSGTVLVDATGYTNLDSKTNMIKGNRFTGLNGNPFIGMVFDTVSNYWYLQDNLGSSSLEDTGYGTIQITNNTVSSVAGGTLSNYGFCLFDGSKVADTDLNGFYITNFNFNRMIIRSSSPYARKALFTVNMNISFGAITTQNFSFVLFKNLDFDNTYQYVFSSSSNNSYNISFSIPVTHLQGDYFELYYASVTDATSCIINTCQVFMKNI